MRSEKKLSLTNFYQFACGLIFLKRKKKLSCLTNLFFSFLISVYLTSTSVSSDHWHYPPELPNGVLSGEFDDVCILVCEDSLRDKCAVMTLGIVSRSRSHYASCIVRLLKCDDDKISSVEYNFHDMLLLS